MALWLATCLLPTSLTAAGVTAAAAPGVVALPPGLVVQKIELLGLKRTKQRVVTRELLLKAGDPLDLPLLEESIQRLKNLRIFSDVRAAIRANSLGKATITLHFDEAWTLIPIVRGGGDEGVLFFVLGAYNVHTFGRYIEVGGQYEYLAGGHSGVVWYRVPRFLDTWWRIGSDLWVINQIVRQYSSDGLEQGAFTMERLRLHLFADKEFRPWLTFGIGLNAYFDDFSDRFQSQASINRNTANGIAPPTTAGRSLVPRVYSTLGRLDYDRYLVHGQTLELELERAGVETGSELSLLKSVWRGTRFWRLKGTQNLGLRGSIGLSTSSAPQHLFYVGALNYLRGFGDGQLQGAAFWQLNAEYRISSIDTRWFVLQHSVFVDSAAVGSTPRGLLQAGARPRFSTGGGVRLISPKIYRLVIRLDYAYAYDQADPHGLAFGVQQYF